MDATRRRSFVVSRVNAPSLVTTSTNLGTHDVGVAADAPPLPRFVPGDVINGRYDVERIVGEGGMGVVYHVRDRMFQLRPTALKTMRRLSEGEWLDLFRSEFIVLSELNHPHVAAVYEFGPLSNGAGHFFTMEFVRGIPLSRACAGAAADDIWDVITQMAEALAYLHGRGILHLDVKPANAVKPEAGPCKLLDFGLVGIAQRPGRIGGTLAYIDPELMQGRQPSELSDLYCLGVSGLELLIGSRPFADAPASVVALAKQSLHPPFTPAQVERIPAAMREALVKLCAPASRDRYGSAIEFLEAATSIRGGNRHALSVSSSAFIGRHDERRRIHEFVHARLTGMNGPVVCAVAAASGVGKSRLVAGVRHEVQARGVAFLQGDAFDHDVGEFTALTPILLASAQLMTALGRHDVVAAYLPELVKMSPELAHGGVASLPYANGQAERERIAHAARDYLVAVSRVTPFAMYLNDLQWAAAGTVDVLGRLIEWLKHDPSNPLAVIVSYRHDQIQDRPVNAWLASMAAGDRADITLAPLDVDEVRSMMRSMLAAPVHRELAERMRDATGGIPFYIDETVRWLVQQDGIRMIGGAIAAVPGIDWHVAIHQRTLRRVEVLGDAGRTVTRLLAVSARPVAFAHLCAASQVTDPELQEVLADLEREHLATPVASVAVMYSLDHDRIREALFASLTPGDRAGLHQRLGTALLNDFKTTRRRDIAVFAAVHLNNTALPDDDRERQERCQLNLDAAQSARHAGDFEQALVFLRFAEAALGPDGWQHHAEMMRVTEQRAAVLLATQQFEGCVATCEAGIARTRDLLAQGRLYVMKMESLTLLRRHDEVLDSYVAFVNRIDPGFKVPRSPGTIAAVLAALKTRRIVKRHGVAHLIRPMNSGQHALATQAVRVTESAVNSAFVIAPNLFAHAASTFATLAARYGTPRDSALTGPVAFCTMLSVLRDFAPVAELGRAVAGLVDQLPDAYRGRARFYWASWPANLSVPLAELSQPLAAAVLECRRARDSTQEANAEYASLTVEFFLAQQPLTILGAKARAARDQWAADEPEAFYYIEALLRSIAILDGSSATLAPYPARSATAEAVMTSFQMATHAFHSVSPTRAGFGWREVRTLSAGLPGTIPERIAMFYAAMANGAALRHRPALSRRLELALVNQYMLRTLKRFAALNPHDFAHRVTAVEAETAWVRGRLQNAEGAYRLAAERAAAAGFRGEHALILERHAEVLTALGRAAESRAIAAASASLYRAWGAVAKAATCSASS
jgi:predicted ATPase